MQDSSRRLLLQQEPSYRFGIALDQPQ